MGVIEGVLDAKLERVNATTGRGYGLRSPPPLGFWELYRTIEEEDVVVRGNLSDALMATFLDGIEEGARR